MASKAHVINDYSFGNARTHARRQLWLRRDSEPIQLPRSSIWSSGAGALVTALTMASLVGGSAYAAFHSTPPGLADTPALPLAEDWQPSGSVDAARLTNLLQGPALAVPNKATVPASSNTQTDTPISSRAERHEAFIDDSGMSPPERFTGISPNTPVAPTGPAETRPAPYPNPTTTPPDAVAPPNTDLNVPTPTFDPENPYRD